MNNFFKFSLVIVIFVVIIPSIAFGRDSSSYNKIANKGDNVYVRDIYSNVDNATIWLKSDNDLDLKLYDAKNNTLVVGWGGGISSGSIINGSYKGDKITWSGWNGRHAIINNDTKSGIDEKAEKGREYIRFYGKSKNNYKLYIYGYSKGNATVEYSQGDNPIYAGIFGMGQDYIQNDSNKNMKTYPAINGVVPSYFKDEWEGYGHTIKQATNVANGAGSSRLKGQIGVAMMISTYAKGAGDINCYTGGNVQYIFNKMKSQRDSSTSNHIYVSGHSSGGGDAQDILWKFKEIGAKVRKSFQIDSAETELQNWGDAKIPSNVWNAFNYYQNNWESVIAPIEKRIYAEDSKKTYVKNIKINDPKGPDEDSPHQAMDNDPRVWGGIVERIRTGSWF